MPNLILEKEWTQWYPKKIFLKNEKNNQKFLYYSDKFTKKDFFIDTKNQKNDLVENNNELKIDLTKTEEYTIGFQKGFSQGKEENVLLEHRLNKLCLDFEHSLSAFENVICSRLLTIVLKISSYVIGKKIDSDEKILIKYIKKIINKDGIFLKKPQIIIHPHNRVLVEKTFKDFFSTHQWILVYDDSMHLNSCKVKSESGYIDATIDARWQELCRLIYSEEY